MILNHAEGLVLYLWLRNCSA